MMHRRSIALERSVKISRTRLRQFKYNAVWVYLGILLHVLFKYTLWVL